MSEAPAKIRLFGSDPNSIVDGPGLRYAIFVQGCSHGCSGCHNPESQPFDGGTLTQISAILDDIRANGLVHDVTISGGEPFDQPEAVAELARQLKAENYGLWVYSGYTYEDLQARANGADPRARATAEILATADVLVDGPFVEPLRSLDLQWRGSSNQRIIDLPASAAAGRVVEWRAPTFVPPAPPTW